MKKWSRWLIFAPAAVLSWFAPLTTSVKADLLGDWTYSQSQDCGGSIEVVENIVTLHGPDNQIQGFGMCGGQAHWVKIETTVPAGVNTVDFNWSYQTNDGWSYDPPQYGINGVYTLITQVNTSSGTLSVPVVEGDIFAFRQYSTDTCCKPGHLAISNLSLWNGIVAPTTTVPDTTVPDTTVPNTTVPDTTVPNTTVPDTTLPETTTSLSPETTAALEASTTTTTELPTPTTTLPPVSSETSDAPPVVDTIPDTTVPDTTPPDTVPPDTLPDAPETPETPPIDITEEIPAELAEALLDAMDSGEPLTEEQFDTAIEALGDLNEEEAAALIEQLLDTDVTADQAEELASNPDVLAVITEEQAEEIFATVDVESLSIEEAELLIEAVQEAPTEVREAFESEINVFGGVFDEYVPTGSVVSVGVRRAVIASIGVIFVTPVPVVSARRK